MKPFLRAISLFTLLSAMHLATQAADLKPLPLQKTIAFPQGYRALRYNPEKQVLGIVTGEGALRGAASIMALGMDPRFDLSHAYWIVPAIAGIDPNVASVGSAAWAEWV